MRATSPASAATRSIDGCSGPVPRRLTMRTCSPRSAKTSAVVLPTAPAPTITCCDIVVLPRIVSWARVELGRVSSSRRIGGSCSVVTCECSCLAESSALGQDLCSHSHWPNARAVLSYLCNNLAMPAASIRARVRAEMIAEIKAVARRHLATDGANLSLRAVARDMGMVSSAIYRYFPSRDDLLTALIIDAYNAVGDAVEKREARVTDRTDLRGRFFAVGHAVRGWALANPAEYALIFGSPVPGYAAPQDSTVAAVRSVSTLISIIVDGHQAGRLGASDAVDDSFTDDVRRDLAAAAEAIAPGLPP